MTDVDPVVTAGMLALLATGMDHKVPKYTVEKKSLTLAAIADMMGTDHHDKGTEKVHDVPPLASVDLL